jgi:hypothetical protein
MTTQTTKKTASKKTASKVEAIETVQAIEAIETVEAIEAIEAIETVEAIPTFRTFMELSVEDIKLDLLAVEMSCSESKKDSIHKNIKARLRACETFAKASDKSLDLIIANSSESTLQQLMNYRNYKTATRILDCANMLSKEGKFSSILTYALNALQRSTMQQTSIDSICAIANQDYSRIANAIKALAFFDLIQVKNADFQDKLIVKMSKNTLVSLASAE